MIRTFRWCLVVFVLFTACKNNVNETTENTVADSTYVLTGDIAGLKDGWIYLFNTSDNMQLPDSAKVSGGRFEFKGKLPSPELHLLHVGDEEMVQPLSFFLEAGKVNISGHLDSFYAAKVTGSVSQQELEAFMEKRKPLDSLQQNIIARYQQAASSGNMTRAEEIQDESLDLEDKYIDMVLQFGKDYPTSHVALFQLAMLFSANVDPSKIKPVFDNFTDNIKQSEMGKQIQSQLTSLGSTSIGTAAPEFTQNDQNDKPVSLSSFKGKYLLIDFWASWCGPCRDENPNVVKAYQQYKHKNFEILGVSLDTKKENWLKAVKDDKLTWANVSDLKGWENAVAVQYGVKGIPINYLLDREGKIVAKNLRGKALHDTLKRILP